ncbi:hypothetical protein WJR50_22070 [Catalinimonas sp. 4WD22]|uniref:hypothetical protein n=1 Tax=Catalinimonas locisalis TaxID=3133978 RepID=UPI003101460F
MKHSIISLLLVLTVFESIACECSIEYELNDYMHSDFVATAIVVEGFKDTLGITDFNMPEYWIKISPTEVFKGKTPDSLKVTGGGMCVKTIKKDTHWLIYAKQTEEGVFQINYCSDSEQIDKYQHSTFPSSKVTLENHKAYMDRKIRQLKILKRYKLDYTYPYEQLHLSNADLSEQLEAYHGITLSNDIAIFELVLDKKLNVQSVNLINGFEANIDEKLIKLLESSAYKFTSQKTSEEVGRKWLIGIYYYPAEDGNPSVLSPWIL